MSSFTPEEVKKLKSGGNAVASRTLLAKWSQHDFPMPDATEGTRLRSFVSAVYVEKRWYSDRESAGNGAGSISSAAVNRPPQVQALPIPSSSSSNTIQVPQSPAPMMGFDSPNEPQKRSQNVAEAPATAADIFSDGSGVGGESVVSQQQPPFANGFVAAFGDPPQSAPSAVDPAPSANASASFAAFPAPTAAPPPAGASSQPSSAASFNAFSETSSATTTSTVSMPADPFAHSNAVDPFAPTPTTYNTNTNATTAATTTTTAAAAPNKVPLAPEVKKGPAELPPDLFSEPMNTNNSLASTTGTTSKTTSSMPGASFGVFGNMPSNGTPQVSVSPGMPNGMVMQNGYGGMMNAVPPQQPVQSPAGVQFQYNQQPQQYQTQVFPGQQATAHNQPQVQQQQHMFPQNQMMQLQNNGMMYPGQQSQPQQQQQQQQIQQQQMQQQQMQQQQMQQQQIQQQQILQQQIQQQMNGAVKNVNSMPQMTMQMPQMVGVSFPPAAQAVAPAPVVQVPDAFAGLAQMPFQGSNAKTLPTAVPKTTGNPFA